MDDFDPPQRVELGDERWEGFVTPADWFYAIRTGRPLTDWEREAGLSPVITGDSEEALREAMVEQNALIKFISLRVSAPLAVVGEGIITGDAL